MSPVPQPPEAIREAGTLEEMERQYVEDALRRCRWRINGRGNAAEVLGLHPNTQSHEEVWDPTSEGSGAFQSRAPLSAW